MGIHESDCMNELNQFGKETTGMPKVSQKAWSSIGVCREAVQLPTVAVRQKGNYQQYIMTLSRGRNALLCCSVIADKS